LVDAVGVGIEDADGAERALDRLVEAEDDRRRLVRDDGVVRRAGSDQPGVAEGNRRGDERQDRGGKRYPATTKRGAVPRCDRHHSSLRSRPGARFYAT
jgi:hypothetical protein